MAGPTLADQIAQLDDAAPTDLDIERLDSGLVADGQAVQELSAGRGHYLDVGASSLRKQQDALADAKYDGARTSRNQLYEFDEGSDEDEPSGRSNDSESSSVDESQEDEVEDEAAEPEREDDTPSDEEQSDNTDDQISTPKLTASTFDETKIESFTEMLKKNREADKSKGRAIIRQRNFYDSLVETRIRMQKASIATNQLPHPNQLPPYVTSDAGREAAQALLHEVLKLSEDLLLLRKRLLEVNEPDLGPAPKQRKLNHDDDLEQQVCGATNSATELDATYHPSCVHTLQKWSSKIAAVTPTPTSRSKSFRGGDAPRPVIELVEDALGESGTTGGKAVGRTRLKRSGGPRIGAVVDLGDGERKTGDGLEGDVEIFDDLDFYQSLLREVIDSRTGGDGIDDWAARQRLKKAKKVVDTKASKGRKLRYEVHEKLQNFMVPVSTGTWHEEQIDELFANLLGRAIGSDQTASV